MVGARCRARRLCVGEMVPALLLLFLGAAAAQIDQTLVDRAYGVMVVEAVIDKIQSACIFPNDRVFLYRIALVESNFGLDPLTYRSNYFGGIWQVSEDRFLQTKDASANPSLASYHTQIKTHFGIDWPGVQWSDLTKPFYSGLAARLYIALLAPDIPWGVEDQAVLWKNFTTAICKEQFITIVGRLQDECEVPKADVVFVLDESGSVGRANYQIMKDWVVRVVNTFNIGKDTVRIGLVTFHVFSEVKFTLDQFSSKDEIVNAVEKMNYFGGMTYTDKGLNDMRTMMVQKRRKDAGVTRIAIVMTDGRSTKPKSTEWQAQLVHREGINTFAVGVTNAVTQSELETIGSQPSCQHVFNLASFNDINHFKNEIARRACRAPTLLALGASFSGTLIKGQSVYLALSLLSKGMTFQLSLKSGSADLYISYNISNPSAAIHDMVLRVDSSSAKGKRIFVPSRGGASAEQRVFAAITGTGFGQSNDFTLGTLKADQSGAAGLANMAALTLLSCIIGLLL